MKSKAGHNRIAAGLMAIMLSFSLVWGGLLDVALLAVHAEANSAATEAESNANAVTTTAPESADAPAESEVSADNAQLVDETVNDSVDEAEFTEDSDADDSASNDSSVDLAEDESTSGTFNGALDEDFDADEQSAENNQATEQTGENQSDEEGSDMAADEQTAADQEPAKQIEEVAEEQADNQIKEQIAAPKLKSLKSNSLRSGSSNGTKKIKVTKTWVNDDDSVRPDVTIYVKQKKSLLLPGSSNSTPNTSPIESKIKQIAGSGTANTNNTNIKAFKYATDAQYEAIKSSLTSANQIQQSGEKTYMWFDSSDGTMYMYSEAGVIYLNNYSGGMFRKMRALEDISGLSHLDTSYVMDMNRMFQDSVNIADFSPISGWNVGYVQNFRFAFGSAASPIGSETFVADSLEPFRNWDVSNVEDMNQMFKVWKNITTLEPIANWDVSRVKDFGTMFTYGTGLTDETRDYIKDWDVRAGTNFSSMFNNAGTITKPIFTLRPGSWGGTSSGSYSPSTPAITPKPHTTPPAIDTTEVEYNNSGTSMGDGSNPGDCIVTKNGNVWTYEFTVPDNAGRWSVWEDTNNGKVDDKNGLADAYTESSGGTYGLGSSETNAIKGVTSSAFITNTNTKRVEITVYKNWSDNSDAYRLRPTNYSDVIIDLNYGGVAVKSTNNDVTKWSGAGNTWTYTKFVHYSNDDASAYTISENVIPGYIDGGSITVTSTGTTTSGVKTGEATITNTLELHKLKVTKAVTGNQADKTKSFDFAFNTTQAGSYGYEIFKNDRTSKTQGTFNTSGNFSLKDGEYIEIKDIPAVFTYTVSENDYSAAGYTTTPSFTPGQSGTDSISGRTVTGKMDADKEIEYDNNKTGALPTGLSFTDNPWLVMIIVTGLAILILIASIIRKSRYSY